jgi:hypothetical protein
MATSVNLSRYILYRSGVRKAFHTHLQELLRPRCSNGNNVVVNCITVSFTLLEGAGVAQSV